MLNVRKEKNLVKIPTLIDKIKLCVRDTRIVNGFPIIGVNDENTAVDNSNISSI